jgi:hypothetical protein
MFKLTQIRTSLAGLGLMALLSACGGGGSSGTFQASTAVTTSFASAYTAGLSGLTAFAGLNSTTLADLFDNAFLDSGSTKADVVAALQSEAQAAATSPDFPSFAQITISDISITNCVAATQVCTLSGTLTNKDVDTTSVPFTTQVKLSDKARLFGDQSAS